MTIDVRTAVNEAMTYFEEIKDLFGNDISDLRLEEIELTEEEKYWLITISFNRKIDKKIEQMNPLIKMPDIFEREYKTWEVDAETGKVKSIKMRVL